MILEAVVGGGEKKLFGLIQIALKLTTLCFLPPCNFGRQEQQLRMYMELKKLRRSVHERMEKNRQMLGKNVKAMTDNLNVMLQHSEWMENANRWISRFLLKFAEGLQTMLRNSSQEESIRTPARKRGPKGSASVERARSTESSR
eukprot:TRINITY_DN18327_c0_g1_i1.p1 TRINITY_DN18327_c0_g1~~TRINITY_DN18327_c0_g1_i1.p1  ORF type:complete len:144 (+),score=25.30 TRINITY_DN18327_c0_g1_i1:118-549(+)